MGDMKLAPAKTSDFLFSLLKEVKGPDGIN
jgi:hypothetical protein